MILILTLIRRRWSFPAPSNTRGLLSDCGSLECFMNVGVVQWESSLSLPVHGSLSHIVSSRCWAFEVHATWTVTWGLCRDKFQHRIEDRVLPGRLTTWRHVVFEQNTPLLWLHNAYCSTVCIIYPWYYRIFWNEKM